MRWMLLVRAFKGYVRHKLGKYIALLILLVLTAVPVQAAARPLTYTHLSVDGVYLAETVSGSLVHHARCVEVPTNYNVIQIGFGWNDYSAADSVWIRLSGYYGQRADQDIKIVRPFADGWRHMGIEYRWAYDQSIISLLEVGIGEVPGQNIQFADWYILKVNHEVEKARLCDGW